MERILILDDDSANLQGIADVLRSEHYSVLAASTGLQAIETGKTCGPISLFLTDMDLMRSPQVGQHRAEVLHACAQ